MSGRKMTTGNLLIRVVLLLFLPMAARADAGPLLQSPAIQGNVFSFSFAAASGKIYSVESTAPLSSYWVPESNMIANGTVNFTNAVQSQQRFYRVESLPQTNLALFPKLPLLSGGAVSLPDAAAGAGYSQTISPQWSGAPPY